MNKKEISEIKKNFKPDNFFGKVSGCYVNNQKNIICEWKKDVISMDDEELKEYIDVFRSVLTGKIGVKLHNLYMDSSVDTKGLLATVKNDYSAIKAMFDSIIANYETTDNYVILYFTSTYDVPGKLSDDSELEDSDDVYDYGVCAVCPVKMSKPGLSYDHSNRNFANSNRDWMLQKPTIGFLYPSFSNRESNAYETLFFAKKDLPSNVIENTLHCCMISDPDTQRQFFTKTLSESNPSISQIANIALSLKESTDSNEQVDKDNFIKALDEANVNTAGIDKVYDESFGTEELTPGAFIDDNLKINAGNTSIKVSAQKASQIDCKIINGQKYIMIPVDCNIEVNDILVRS